MLKVRTLIKHALHNEYMYNTYTHTHGVCNAYALYIRTVLYMLLYVYACHRQWLTILWVLNMMCVLCWLWFILLTYGENTFFEQKIILGKTCIDDLQKHIFENNKFFFLLFLDFFPCMRDVRLRCHAKLVKLWF